MNFLTVMHNTSYRHSSTKEEDVMEKLDPELNFLQLE